MPNHPYTLDEKLRKVERLRRRAQFLHVQRRGRRLTGPNLVVYAHPNGLEWSRIGLTVSKKVGHAPLRSRWKRLLREAFRRHKSRIPLGMDLVVIVKPKRVVPPLDHVVQELCSLGQGALQPARVSKK